MQQHLSGRGHDVEISVDVDDVRADEEQYGAIQQPSGIMGLDHRGEPHARHPADPAAHLLHGDHQRHTYGDQPEEEIPELGAGDRIGADPGGIVVGCAGDQTGPQRGPDRLADPSGQPGSLRLLQILRVFNQIFPGINPVLGKVRSCAFIGLLASRTRHSILPERPA